MVWNVSEHMINPFPITERDDTHNLLYHRGPGCCQTHFDRYSRRYGLITKLWQPYIQFSDRECKFRSSKNFDTLLLQSENLAPR